MLTDSVPVRVCPSAATPDTFSLKVSDLYRRLGAGNRESQAVMLSMALTRMSASWVDSFCSAKRARMPSISAVFRMGFKSVRSLLTAAVLTVAEGLSKS